MASNATISVNDGLATPVAHAYDPVRIVGDVASYQNKTALNVEGRETLSAKLSKSAKVRICKLDLRIPLVVSEVINGLTVYRVDSFATVKTEVLIPINWTAAQAKNARVLMSNLLVHATVGLMVDEHEFVW